MITLNHEKLSRHLLRTYQKQSLSQNQLCEKINIARSTLWRLQQGKTITVESLLKIINYIDKPINEYFTKKEL